MSLATQSPSLRHEKVRLNALSSLCVTLFGTSAGNLFVGAVSDLFGARAMAEPITKAVVLGMTPCLPAIPCFFRAAMLVEQLCRLTLACPLA